MPQDHVIKYLLPIIPHWLKPNYLTFIRLVASPLLIMFLNSREYKIGLVLFIILALTDLFDGSIARLRDQITDWGKVWDPVADKFLIGIVVVVLLYRANPILAMAVVGLELAFITGSAFLKLKYKDLVEIKSNIWGKLKMVCQCFGAGLLMLGFVVRQAVFLDIGEMLFYPALFLGVLSIWKKGL